MTPHERELNKVKHEALIQQVTMARIIGELSASVAVLTNALQMVDETLSEEGGEGAGATLGVQAILDEALRGPDASLGRQYIEKVTTAMREHEDKLRALADEGGNPVWILADGIEAAAIFLETGAFPKSSYEVNAEAGSQSV
jgi:hypothetical protein